MTTHDLSAPTTLDLKLSRWGNSLAVRLPLALARELRVTEGDALRLQLSNDGVWRLSNASGKNSLSKAQWLARARRHLRTMPPSAPVIGAVRAAARY